MMNLINPDIILIVGDTIDEIHSAVYKKLGDPLRNLHSKYGVYAVLGNHEYISDVDESLNFLTNNSF